MELPVPVLASQEGGSGTCRAVFIRAPAIVNVGPSVQVLAEYPLAPGQAFDVSEQVKIENMCSHCLPLPDSLFWGDTVDFCVVFELCSTSLFPCTSSPLFWHQEHGGLGGKL